MKTNDKKPAYYVAAQVLVEMEVKASSQEEADGILRRKLQMFAASNSDLALHQMVSRTPQKGYDLIPLP